MKNNITGLGKLISARSARQTRRQLLRRAMGAGLGIPLASLGIASCDLDDSSDSNSLPTTANNASGQSVPSGPVPQIKGLRSGTGLRGYDREKASAGYTLFAPNDGDDVVYLIDMEGNVEHTWEMPYPPGLYGYLRPDGTLFYNGRSDDESNELLNEQPFKGGVVLEADWNGNVLWEVKHPDHHHDGIRLSNGNVMLLCLTELPEELVPSVQGGRSGSEADGKMYADYLVEMTLDGETVWEWRSWEHLDPETDVIVAAQDSRDEWTHGNAVTELQNGNIAVSFRSTCNVAIIDRETGEIIWKLGPPTLAQQHAPVELENGNLLIFDNGTHRVDHSTPYSRAIEVNVDSKEIVWGYQEPDVSDFFSPYISNAQRLPNGNTLICEGNFGRFFEVTTDGEVVWEYVNPYFGPRANDPDVITNAVFRCYRYTEQQIEQARSTV